MRSISSFEIRKTDAMKDRSHSARYLILIGPRTARRALLFNHEHRYLSEVIDDQDGLMIETLLCSGIICDLPSALRLDGIVPAAQLATPPLECFDLCAAAAAPRTLETADASNA